MSLDVLTNAPTDFPIGNRVFKVGALKLRELGELQAYVRTRRPDPVKELMALLPNGISTREEREALKDATRERNNNWPPAIGTDEGNRALLEELDGQRLFLRVALGKFQPITDAEIDDVLGSATYEDLSTLLVMAIWGEVFSDPKSAREFVRLALLQTVAAVLPSEPAPETIKTDRSGQPAQTAASTGASSSPS